MVIHFVLHIFFCKEYRYNSLKAYTKKRLFGYFLVHSKELQEVKILYLL
jgi:hypothetical protein